MKATLHFDLDDNDDAMAHLRCVKSTKLAISIFEILYQKKKEIEYLVDAGKLDVDTFDKIFEVIIDVLEDNNIKIEELIN